MSDFHFGVPQSEQDWHALALKQAECILNLTKIIMAQDSIQASDVTLLVNALNTVLTAEASDQAALSAAQATVAQLQANNAAFADPTLIQSVNTVLANAAAANPPPVVPPVVSS